MRDSVPNTSDVGMVHLRKAVRGKDVYTVAPEGYLQKLATQRGLQDELLTVVGYGVQAVRPFPTSVRRATRTPVASAWATPGDRCSPGRARAA